MPDKFIDSSGIQIRTEYFGDETGEPLLLIMGAGTPGLYWQETFIQRLVDAGNFVVRYDHRDTGKSTCVEYSEHPYTLDELTQDAIAVMDAYGMTEAHIAGASMGGMIAQILMIQHADRLKSATIIMSSPLSGPETDTLAAPDPVWMEKLIGIVMSPATGDEATIERKVEQFRMLAGGAQAFDEDYYRKIISLELEQASNIDAANNHIYATAASSPLDRRPLLASVDLPALIVHGTEDPSLPFAHGISLSEVIKGSELMALEGAGHELPNCYTNDVVSRMIELQRRSL